MNSWINCYRHFTIYFVQYLMQVIQKYFPMCQSEIPQQMPDSAADVKKQNCRV